MNTMRPSALQFLFERLLELSVKSPPCTSTSPAPYWAERPMRRSKPNALVKAARSICEMKRSLVSSSSPWKDLCRSEEHTSELQSLMRISYAVFCLKKKIQQISLDHRTT